MTPGRAAFLVSIEAYGLEARQVTLIELQKLAYFLQAAGEPLGLDFVEAAHGPYAEKLSQVLDCLSGHHLRGLDGDPEPMAAIELVGEYCVAAHECLAWHPDTAARLGRVERLIEGFETPHGLELLATVHRVATCDGSSVRTLAAASSAVRAWHQGRRSFDEHHLAVAWGQLVVEGWIAAPPESPAAG